MAGILSRIVPRKMLKGLLAGIVLLLSLQATPCPAGETDRIYPGLTLDGKTWRYDLPRAMALSDRYLEAVRRLSSYSCRVQVFYALPRPTTPGRRGSASKSNEEFDLTIFYNPKTAFVRMQHPRKGATLFYRSVDRVTDVRPFSFTSLSLSLSPHSGMITSRFGHTIDHSDFRSFGKRVLRPACLTHSCLYLGSGHLEGHAVDILNVAPDQLEARPLFGRMWIILDRSTTLPLSVSTYGPNGRFWERIDYGACHFSNRS